MDASCSEMTQLARSILEYGRMKAQDTAMVLGAAGTLLDAMKTAIVVIYAVVASISKKWIARLIG